MNAWAFYDWANSTYSLTINSAVFPSYFEAVTSPVIDVFGRPFPNTTLYGYTISLAFLLSALSGPLLSGIADFLRKKRAFMHGFVMMGSIACASLFFFHGGNIWLGLGGLLFATWGFAGSLVFYNGFLPEIATPDRHDRLSARGFALGYIGSVLLLIVNLMMIQQPAWFGIPESMVLLPAQISFLSVGIWWYGFSQVTLQTLPEPQRARSDEKVLLKGFRELKKVWLDLQDQPQLKIFLASFFFYSMGVQTVMYMAVLFGSKELNLPPDKLIITILSIQLIAIAGAFFFSYISKKFGNVMALIVLVTIWIGICGAAYFVFTFNQFLALAIVVGSVMGGIQSMSRSTYSKLLPDTRDNASYFSFYEFTEKIAIVIGTAAYAFIEDYTGNMRNSVFALSGFFIIGLGLLFLLKKRSRHIPAVQAEQRVP